ncbi:diguanylate cyclase domain-containing protein [Undibacterium sp. Ren11W]|uniref:diguanylate cyclase domain-containing protein n=1 Tax=Undibacterium sp. Ren11W TaxID=3413045 RepID=UPI003BF14E15
MMRLFRTSIVFRSTFVLLTIIVLIGTLFAAYSYFTALRHEYEHGRERMIDLLSTVENTTSIACFVSDRTLASEVSGGLIRNKDVRSVKIIAGTDVLAYSERKKISGNAVIKMPGERAATIERDVFSPFNAKEKVCRIVLEPDQAFLQNEAISSAQRVVFLLILQSFLLATAVVLVVIHIITRPIKNISDCLHRLSPDSGAQLELPIGNEHDEIGQLVGDVNALVTSLVSTLDEERQLRISHQIGEKKFKTIFDNTETGIFLINTGGTVLSYNQAFLRTLGLASDLSEQKSKSCLLEALVGQEMRLHLMIDQALTNGQAVGEDFSIDVAPNNDNKWLNIVISSLEDGVFQGLLNDITSRKAREENAQHLAVTDHLTGVDNRLGFDLELQKLAKEVQHDSTIRVFLFLIDLDKFKQVNDVYGHEAGDKVLIHFTQILRKTLRKTDFIGRLGGDEFVILVRDLDNPAQAEKIAKNIINRTSVAIPISAEIAVEIGASIGISFSHGLAFDREELLRQADEAMYEVKRHGRNNFRIFSED